MNTEQVEEELVRLETFMRHEFSGISLGEQAHRGQETPAIGAKVKTTPVSEHRPRLSDFQLYPEGVDNFLKWIGRTQALPAPSTHFCLHCGDFPADGESLPRRTLKKCTGCRKIWYCSTQCQKDNWPVHKVECNTLTMYRIPTNGSHQSPLNSTSGEIRLLCLLPGHRGSSLKCELSKAYIDKASTTYEALSYTWGNADIKRAIAVDGKPFMITSNLYDALQDVRDPEHRRVIWVDAVCINQVNLREKVDQIHLLRRIYSSAKQFLMWVRPASYDSDLALRAIRSMAQLDYGHMKHRSRLLDQFGKLFMDDMVASLALARFAVLRPYWNRAWVVQEVTLAKKAVVICGQDSISWDCVQRANQHIRLYEQFLMSSIGVFPLFWKNIAFLANLATQFDLKPSILYYLQHMRSRQCFDHRDKIYAILGLTCREDTSDFVINYSDTVEQVYTRFAIWHIRHTKSLHVLGYASLENTSPALQFGEMPSLHSWVPDWRSSFEPGLVTLWKDVLPVPFSQYRAGTKFQPPDNYFLLVGGTADYSSDGDFPTFGGFIVDRIKEVAQSFTPRSRSAYPNSKLMRRWMSMMRSIPHDSNPYTSNAIDTSDFMYVAHEGYPGAIRGKPDRSHMRTFHYPEEHNSKELIMMEAFWRTLLYDIVLTHVLPIQPETSIAEERIIEDISGSLRPNRNFWPIWQYWYDQYTGKRPVESTSSIFSDMIEVSMANRSFMITHKGYMGTVGPQAKVGDAIAVVLGAQQPQVLRKTDLNVYEGGDQTKPAKEVHRRVGDCYLHGIMYGEALTDMIEHLTAKDVFIVV